MTVLASSISAVLSSLHTSFLLSFVVTVLASSSSFACSFMGVLMISFVGDSAGVWTSSLLTCSLLGVDIFSRRSDKVKTWHDLFFVFAFLTLSERIKSLGMGSWLSVFELMLSS